MVRRDTITPDLLSWTPTPVVAGYADDVAGRGPWANKIARLVSRALRDAKDERGLSRSAIAKAMSARLERSVSEATLNKWASEAGDDRMIPLDAFAALIEATSAHDLLGFLPGLFGFVAVPARYADLIELHEIDEHAKEVEHRRSVLQSKLRARR